MRAAHHVAAGGQRAERGAVVALAAGDGADALRLADLDEILARQLDRRLVALGAGGAEPGVGQAAGFVVEHDLGEFLGRLVGEGAGVRVGHGGGLPPMASATRGLPWPRQATAAPPEASMMVRPSARCR